MQDLGPAVQGHWGVSIFPYGEAPEHAQSFFYPMHRLKNTNKVAQDQSSVPGKNHPAGVVVMTIASAAIAAFPIEVFN